MEKVMNVPDTSASVQSALSTLNSSLPMLQKVGFESIVYEDFYSEFEGLVKSIHPSPGMIPLDETHLLEAFQKPEGAYTLIASAVINLNFPFRQCRTPS
jgi:ubiquitin thioesterase protein OTUB1